MGENDGHRSRLRERFWETGLESFQEHEVLELLLFYAIPYRDTNALAHRLINEFGSLAAVCDAPMEKLTSFPGIGDHAATLLNFVSPLTRRYLASFQGHDAPLNSTQALGQFLQARFCGLRTEVVYLLCMDAKYKPLQCSRVGNSGLSFAHVDLRQAIEMALKCKATFVVLGHNHPSGIALPSEADLTTTKVFQEQFASLGIRLVDHLIFAEDDFVSLYESGNLSP